MTRAPINDRQGRCEEPSEEGVLLALAERCEKAAGPDRELDGQIDRLLNTRPSNGDYDEHENAIWSVKDASGLLIRGDGFAPDSFCASAYTASLDAAVSLVPEGCGYALRGVLGKKPCASIQFHSIDGLPPSIATADGWSDWSSGNSPALALCAAALRARAQSGAAS